MKRGEGATIDGRGIRTKFIILERLFVRVDIVLLPREDPWKGRLVVLQI